jgi:hypothetical protein
VVGVPEDRGVLWAVVAAPGMRDGVIGVSSVGPGLLAGTTEQPATSIDAAHSRAIRIPPG